MLKRRLLVALLAVFGIASVEAASGSAPSEGPELAVMRLMRDPSRLELATVDPSGADYRPVLTRRLGRRFPRPLGPVAWSPDGSLLAYSQRVKGEGLISVVSVDGGSLRVISGTQGGDLPVFSPDGQSLAFARYRIERAEDSSIPTYRSSSIWIVDLVSGLRRQLTRWRNELWQSPSSFAPDGSTLLLNRLDYRRSAESEIVALRFDGRTSGLLVGEGERPLYSPDGTKVLFSRWNEPRKIRRSTNGTQRFQETADLYVVNADGSGMRRLTRTPGKTELLGGWDPLGQRIAYAQFRGFPLAGGRTGSIVEINADGTCRRKILSITGATFFNPTWRPGTGRAAGRIAC